MARSKKRAVKANTGAKKALAAFIKRYGAAKGRAAFFATGSKYGTRKRTPSQKTNQVFGKGSHRISSVRKRRKKR